MVKYIGVICVFLGVVCGFLYLGYSTRGKEIVRLETEKKALNDDITNLKKEYNEKMEVYKNAQETSAELVKALRLKVAELNDNDIVDCFNSVIPDEYRELLGKLK